MANTARFKQLAPRMMRDLMRDFAPLADFQAAGAVGNGGGESGGFTVSQEGKPTVAGSRGGWGGFQWTGPRRRTYEKYITSQGRNPSDANAALDYDIMYGFLKQELQTSERATIPALRRATNVTEATKAFMVAFERPGVPHFEGRVYWSKLALDTYLAEQGKIAKNPPIVSVPTVGPVPPVKTEAKQGKENAGFWTKVTAGIGVAGVGAYNLALQALPWILGVVGLVVLFIYIFRPAYLRWRDCLQYAPELQDANWRTKLNVFTEGFRTKMLARLTEGVAVLIPIVNVAGEWVGTGGMDLSSILPSIPLGGGVELGPTQYISIIGLGIGRANDYLRSRTKTEEGKLSFETAQSITAQSDNVVGSTPTLPLAMATDMSQAEIVTHIERVVKKVRAKKVKRKARR